MRKFANIAPYLNTVKYLEARKGAHFTEDMIHFFNTGDLVEKGCKYALHFNPVKSANAAYDVEADIPELGWDVKSANAGLSDKLRSRGKAAQIDEYFNNAVATHTVWAIIEGDYITMYVMTEDLFRKFVETFGTERQDGKVRLPGNTAKVLRWLKDKC